MKLLAAVLVLAAVCRFHASAKPIHQSGLFKEAFEKYMKLLRTGNETLGIPKLDPYVYDPKNDFLKHPIFNEYPFSEYIVRGITNNVVNYLSSEQDGNVITESINILWPNITVDMKYINDYKIVSNDELMKVHEDVKNKFIIENIYTVKDIKFKIDYETKDLNFISFNGSRVVADRVEMRGIINNVRPINDVIQAKEPPIPLFEKTVNDLFEQFFRTYSKQMWKTVDHEKLLSYLGMDDKKKKE